MGRKNIITQIDELDLDHDQEHFEEHLDVIKKDKVLKNAFVKLDVETVNLSEEVDDESKLQKGLSEEQIAVVEKSTKNSRKKNTNQESSS